MSKSRGRPRAPGSARPNAAPVPLYHGIRLPYSVSLPVLGVAVEFASNSRVAMEAVEQSFGIWRRLASSAPRGRPVRVSIIEHDGHETGRRPFQMTWRVPDDRRMIGFTAGSGGVADFERRDVFIYVTADIMADRPHFCYSVLEAFTLTAIGQADRSPIHAGAVVRGESVLLLTGASGAGKSTLVYAAMRSGLRVLADDAVYVQLKPELNIWGVPARICLLPKSRRLFPEIAAIEPSILANGKTKIVVPVDRLHAARVPIAGHRVAVVLLAPPAERVTIAPLGPLAIRRSLAAELHASFVHLRSSREVIRRVGERGGWRLTLSRDPAEALPFLHEILDELDGAPVAGKARGR